MRVDAESSAPLSQEQLVQLLYDGRRDPTQFGPPDIAMDLDTALELQLAVADRFVGDGARIGGWKVGLTSGRGLDMMGKGFRPHGYILASRIFDSHDRLDLTGIQGCAVEPELCLVLGADLVGPATSSQARAAVRAIAPAFEINEFRVGRDAGHGLLLADGLRNWGLVIGSEVSPDTLTPDLSVTLFRGNRQVARATIEEVALEDPFLSIARMASLLARRGRVLKAGQPIITGAFAQAPVTEPGVWRADFGPIGDVSVTFG